MMALQLMTFRVISRNAARAVALKSAALIHNILGLLCTESSGARVRLLSLETCHLQSRTIMVRS